MGTAPTETRTWTATFGIDNHIPPKVTHPDGNSHLLTGAEYDPLGRLRRILAIPGDVSTFTQWSYDPEGRITEENGTRFLLDGQGLRFRREKPDGSLVYTIYDFDRKPITIFECGGE